MTTNSHDSVDRAARYAQHVTDLARAFGIKLKVSAGMAPDEAAAGVIRDLGNRVVGRYVRIKPVRDETAYVVALHELGHCVHPTGSLFDECSASYRADRTYADFRDIKLVLESERSAWAWAKQFALEWTPAMEQVHVMCMTEYLKIAKRMGLKGEVME